MATDITHHRHRPAPLAPTSQPGHRGQLLSSLRTARPAQTPTPQMMTAFDLQQQANFLALQQQILLQQQQLILAHRQQQAEAEAAMSALRLSTGPVDEYSTHHRRGGRQLSFDGRTSSLVTPEDEEAVRDNPLAASALARRKRQSFTMEPSQPAEQRQQQATTLASRRVSYGGPPPVLPPLAQHHRRASSTASATSYGQRDLRSPTRSWSTGTDTPAVILSAPGEAFPSPTSSTEEGVIVASTATPSPSRHARRVSVDVRSSARSSHSKASSLSSNSDEGRIAPWLEGIKEATTANVESAARRPSQASQLAAALSGRRQRPASMNGSAAGLPPIDTRATYRSASDSAAPASTVLSPFATTFQPLPASPFTPSPTEMNYPAGGANYHQYQQPRYSPPLNSRTGHPGAAVAVRQPRGPDADLSTANFAARLRRRAIATLLRADHDVRGARVMGFEEA